MTVSASRYASSVFINCPFDTEYQPLFRAVVFTLVDCGYTPRCALELNDGAAVRIERIFQLIDQCRLAIHDISRVTLEDGYPRFNMPLELGVFLGARRFGSPRHRRKSCLIFEQAPNSYDIYCSDISGQDVRAHERDVARVVAATRDWLRNDSAPNLILPGAGRIVDRLSRFLLELPLTCQTHGLDAGELIFRDFFALAAGWKEANPLT